MTRTEHSGRGTEAHRLLTMLYDEALPSTRKRVERIARDMDEGINSDEVAKKLVQTSPHLLEVHEFMRRVGRYEEKAIKPGRGRIEKSSKTPPELQQGIENGESTPHLFTKWFVCIVTGLVLSVLLVIGILLVGVGLV